jgi:hypothetical protein
LVQGLLYVVVVVAGLLCGPLLIDGLEMAFAPAPVLAAAPQQEVQPSSEEAALAVHECSIQNVGVFDNRVHVRCWNGAGAVFYFAAPTSDAVRANRILSLLLTAQAAGKRLEVGYDPAANGSGFGCQVANCRPIIHVLALD